MSDWQPIETAPKDGTPIWVILRDDLDHIGRSDMKPWNGLQLPMLHRGLADDGFDIGWQVAAPVGHGGFPDRWIAGWMPLPPPPEEKP